MYEKSNFRQEVNDMFVKLLKTIIYMYRKTNVVQNNLFCLESAKCLGIIYEIYTNTIVGNLLLRLDVVSYNLHILYLRRNKKRSEV